MEGPYSARLPSSPIGEKSRRASDDRGTADGRAPLVRPAALARAWKRRGANTMTDQQRTASESGDPTAVEPTGLAATDRSTFRHEPVMLAEVVAVFAPLAAGVVVDATVGGGGHSHAILEANDAVSVVGLDQDPTALAAAAVRLAVFGDRVILCRARFDDLGAQLAALDIASIVGFLFDLGVSSPQLDRAERGFSYRREGPLDMRMDPAVARDAAAIVNNATERELTQILQEHGDERFASRIAAAIVRSRPITTTTMLADVVRDAIPAASATPRRTSGEAHVPSASHRGQSRTRDPARRARPSACAPGPGRTRRRVVVSLRRGSHRQGAFSAGRNRRLYVSSEPSMRLWRRADCSAVDTRWTHAVRRGDRTQSTSGKSRGCVPSRSWRSRDGGGPVEELDPATVAAAVAAPRPAVEITIINPRRVPIRAVGWSPGSRRGDRHRAAGTRRAESSVARARGGASISTSASHRRRRNVRSGLRIDAGPGGLSFGARARSAPDRPTRQCDHHRAGPSECAATSRRTTGHA